MWIIKNDCNCYACISQGVVYLFSLSLIEAYGYQPFIITREKDIAYYLQLFQRRFEKQELVVYKLELCEWE